jgi:predicted nucleic acid-binding protein
VIVVDASVAIKWLIPEQDEEAARSLLVDEVQLVAPAVIRVEAHSAILRSFREGKLGGKEARAACEVFERVLEGGLLQLISDEDIWELALKLAFQARHSFADCLYLAVGKSVGAPVVTSDKLMAQRGGKASVQTVLLGEYAARGISP